MSYSYQTERPYVFSEEGSENVMRAKNYIDKALEQHGAVRCEEAMSGANFKGCPTSWERLVCIDRLVEIGEIRGVREGRGFATQHQVYIKGNK